MEEVKKPPPSSLPFLKKLVRGLLLLTSNHDIFKTIQYIYPLFFSFKEINTLFQFAGRKIACMTG